MILERNCEFFHLDCINTLSSISSPSEDLRAAYALVWVWTVVVQSMSMCGMANSERWDMRDPEDKDEGDISG